MILLFIISNNILQSLLIVLIYYLILDNLSIQYTRSHLFIVENRLFFIILLKNTLIYYLIVVLISTYQHLICWDLTFLYLDHPTEFYNS